MGLFLPLKLNDTMSHLISYKSLKDDVISSLFLHHASSSIALGLLHASFLATLHTKKSLARLIQILKSKVDVYQHLK